MKSEYRLKKQFQYNYVFKHSQSVGDKLFVVLYCTSRQQQTKVGFSVSNKYGHAVQRNRLRRQMKAVVSSLMPQMADFYNVVIIPRKHNEPYLFDDIMQSFSKLFAKAGLLK